MRTIQKKISQILLKTKKFWRVIAGLQFNLVSRKTKVWIYNTVTWWVPIYVQVEVCNNAKQEKIEAREQRSTKDI